MQVNLISLGMMDPSQLYELVLFDLSLYYNLMKKQLLKH